jgi:hypothetical protein
MEKALPDDSRSRGARRTDHHGRGFKHASGHGFRNASGHGFSRAEYDAREGGFSR